jgi:hypothetical protein
MERQSILQTRKSPVLGLFDAGAGDARLLSAFDL